MAQPSTKRIDLLAHGPVGKALLALSAPAIAGMLVMAIYNVADTFFVSLLRDTTAIAATGVVFPIFQLIGAVGLTFGMGAASVISRRLGENNRRAADEAGATALYTSAAVGIAFSLTGAVLIEPILTLFGATDSILAEATLYGRLIIGGSVFQIVNMTVGNILRSEGAALHSSAGQIVGAVLNIALDPLFIFTLNMGITGAAAATVVAQAVAMLALLSFYLLKRGVLSPLSLRHVRIEAKTYAAIMTLGLPTLVRQVLGSVSFGVLNNAAAAFGDSAIAAISLMFRVFMLLFMALIGLAHGLQPLAGYNYGAHRFDRVRATMQIVFVTVISLGAVASVGGYMLAPAIMRFFAPQDARVIVMGAQAMRYMAFALVPIGLVVMFGGIFQAFGDGRSAMILAAGQQGLFLIPAVLILPRLFGLPGVFAAQPVGFILAFAIGLLLMRRTYRNLRLSEQEYGGAPVPAESE